jgi:DUF4097 and DUF4098 domain-containing protein YvlB
MKRLALTLALAATLPAAYAATPFDETRPLDADAKVSLENIKGTIEVDTWDRNEIRITGQRGEGTEALRIEGDASDLRVKIVYPEHDGWFSGWGNRGEDSELRVTVPKGVSLDAEAVSADVEVRGVAGAELSVESVSGKVVVDTGATDVEASTVSGDLTVAARSTDVSVESVSGDVELSGEISGRIDMEAVSGGLRLDSRGNAKHVSAGVVSGDIELRTGLQPGGRISAESLSGDLELILPAGSSAQLSASSFTGTIRSDQGKVDTEEHGPGSSLETKLGSGDGRIELETFSGDLTVRSQ